MKKLFALMLALAMLLCLFAGCGSTGSTAPADNSGSAPADNSGTSAPADSTPADNSASGAYKFGGLGPLTGDAAIYGMAVRNGAQIAVDEINALGGVQLELNFQDDVSDAETSVNAYNTLIDWGMQALVGTVTTGPCIAVSAEAYKDRVFCMTPSASSTDVTAGKDNMFQVCFTDPNQGTGAATYLNANMPDSKVAIIYQNDDAYSQGIRDTFKAQADSLGLEVVYEGTFTKDTATDFSVQLTGAQNEGANLVFLPIYYTPASVILTQANDMGYAPTFFGVDGMDGILTLEGFDLSLAEGVMLLTPFAADAGDDLTRSFVAEYEKRHGETPNQFAADGYDVVYVLYQALEQAGCTPDMSAEEICEALVGVITSVTYTGLTGTDMTWSANGEVSKLPTAVVIKDGVYVTA
ncbi:MAG: ABC transporter substrate-binding protein [Butyricicoccus sp.]|nr:ABC transporter substrate-binding protein [Butyricicoccus sp.]